MSELPHPGVTPSEQWLGLLARHSFLRLWCQSNPYRRVGAALAGAGDGKEVCDLVVAFDRDLVLFSDKRSQFQLDREVQLAWDRWYRNTVVPAARSLVAARKWFLGRPDEIFADRKCLEPLRLPIPAADVARVHLVAVVSGTREACQLRYGGGSGSLLISTDLDTQSTSPPFVLPRVTYAGHWVHVFDEASIDRILTVLDTTRDFIEYLRARERFLSASHVVMATGEEELLATYLLQNRPSDSRWGLDDSLTGYAFIEGTWSDLCEDPRFAAGVELNEVSYYWDRLIEQVTEHLIEVGSDDRAYWLGGELALRTLARANRHERRALSMMLLDCIRSCPPKSSLRRTLLPTPGERAAIVFAVYPTDVIAPFGDDAHTATQHILRNLIDVQCCLLRDRVDAVVGLSIVVDEDGWGLIGIGATQHTEWTPEEIGEVEVTRKQSRFWDCQPTELIGFHSVEFPDATVQEQPFRTHRIEADELCPCGSGMLAAVCCGQLVKVPERS